MVILTNMIKTFDINRIPDEFKGDINTAISILKEYGCREIYIFGSLAEGNINMGSDIDFAVKGIDESSYFLIWSRLYMTLNHAVDLVNLDKDDRFGKFLLSEDSLFRVA